MTEQKLNLTMDVDLDEVEELITSDKFAQFLLNNTVNFSTGAFVLQSAYEALMEAKGMIKQKSDENE